MSGLDIVFQDEYLVVVNKPSGLLSVPGRTPELQDCVVSRLKDVFPDCLAQPAVHRLDMDTSGLLVLALTKEVHRELSIQFQNREVKKRYEALLDGILDKESGEIELPFRLDIDDRPRQIYDPIHGKMGKTIWYNLGIEGENNRIDFRPTTGRTHQLRLHSSHHLGLGIPIVGDRLYGNGTVAGELKLHATFLSFHHPKTNDELFFDSKSPF